jgi:riboflavin biosynthesis pyrimidine reductase
MQLQRIHPEHGLLTPEEATGGLRLGDLAPPARPYVVLNMIASADGAASVYGRTRALGDRMDRAIFHGLRTQVDCVMVGAGTARIERYGRMVRDAANRDRRRDEGLALEPLTCIVSASLGIPADLPLLGESEARVVVMTASDGELPPARATVEYLRSGSGDHSRRPALAPLVGRLRSEHGVRSVLCEGGPTLNAALLAEGLVDELFLTVSPKLVAGSPQITIVAGEPAPQPVELALITCLESESALYLRYRLSS